MVVEEEDEAEGEGEEFGAVEGDEVGPVLGETGKVQGGEGVGTAMGTLPPPLFSRLLRPELGTLPTLLPLLVLGRFRVAVRTGLVRSAPLGLVLLGLVR